MLSHRHPELNGSEYVVFVDSSRRYVDCSEGVCKLLGHSRSELLQKTIDDISYDLESVPRLFSEYVSAGLQEGEFLLQSKEKAPVPIKYKAYVFSDGCKAAVWEPVGGWKRAYLSALVEFDAVRLKTKLQQAVSAIREAQLLDSSSPQEAQALADALAAMNLLAKGLR